MEGECTRECLGGGGRVFKGVFRRWRERWTGGWRESGVYRRGKWRGKRRSRRREGL